MKVRAPEFLGWALEGVLLFVGGCVLSVEPVVPETEAIFEEGLLGTWEDQDFNRLVISRASDSRRTISMFPSDYAEKIYLVSDASGAGSAGFLARLGRLGDALVMEVFPRAEVRGHVLLVVELRPDLVRWQALDPTKLVAALEAGDLRLAYRRLGRDVLLREPSATLREQLAGHVLRPGALLEPRILRRVPDMSAGEPAVVQVPCFEASPWHEADRLFRRDLRWLGTDSASSVDLGGGRILWLFGNSWVDPRARGGRHQAQRVANTIAVQSGADPATADIDFYWGEAADGSPTGFFPSDGDDLLRPGHGVRLDDRLIIFLIRLRMTWERGEEVVGWTAVMVSNPDADPAAWRVRFLTTEAIPFGLRVGYTGVLRHDDHVYAFGAMSPLASPPVYVARWPENVVHRGRLKRPEWWAGESFGWVPHSSSAQRWPVFEQGQPELAIHFDPQSEQFIAMQTLGQGAADIALRAAPSLEGPWSDAQLLYRPAEYYRQNVVITGVRAHPGLSGSEFVLTYNTSSARYIESLTDQTIYYPRFLRLMTCSER
jgi:hypothetical protein